MGEIDETWIRKQFVGINLGDFRLNKRALCVAKACGQNPHFSIPQKFEEWGDIKGAYRLFANAKATHQAIQAPHYRIVKELAAESTNPVLFIQDGSELLFNSHQNTPLGPTSDSYGNGMMLHTSLAVCFNPKDNTAEILGLAHQKCWVRPELPKKAAKDERESNVWAETLEKIGSPKKVHHWISVGDRGNDIYSFLTKANAAGWGFVVRAKHNRHIMVNGKKHRLHSWVRALVSKKSYPVYLRARGGEFSGEVELQLSWAQAVAQDPKKKDEKGCSFTYVRVHCPEKPKIEWILVTNLSIDTENEALMVVEMYRKRWLIEEYHKALKTGCRIEECQMRSAERLQAILGFLGVIASRLLAIKEGCRVAPFTPASATIPKDMITLVTRYFKMPFKGISTRDFWRLVAKLGGFMCRKSDGEPGWQTIWRGFLRIQDMLLGASLL